MGNLLSLDPKIHSLGTDAKKLRSLPNCEWIFLRDCRASPVEFNEKVAIHMTFLWLSSGWSIAALFRPLFVTSPESPSNTVISSVRCPNHLWQIMRFSSELAVTVEKVAGTTAVPEGGRDPGELLCGLAAKKSCGSRPAWSFFHAAF